ncbi:MAG: ABC transporter substrate-binding protein [bacterium]
MLIPERKVTTEESLSYQRAQQLYKQGKYREASGLFQKAAGELSDPEKIAGARYMVSLCSYRMGKHSDAILEGRNLIEDYPLSRHADDAMLVVARSYSKKENYLQAAIYVVRLLSVSKDSRLVPGAEKMLSRLIKEKLNTQQLQKLARDFPSERFAPMFLYHAARLEMGAGRRSRGAEIARKIEARYSGSEYAKKASRMLKAMAGMVVKRTIGLLLPLSGDYYVYGTAVQHGVSLGLDTTRFRLVTYDTRGDPIEALKGARSMIENDDVLAIIGPVLSMPTIAAAAIANTENVVLISPTSTEGRISTIGPYIFQLNLSLQSQAEAIADFAVSSLGHFDLAVIYPKDAYGEGLSRIFRDKVASLGGRVLLMQGYEPGTTDFREQINAIKAAAPQVVFIPAYPDDIVLIAPQLRYYEFEGIMLGAGGWYSEKVTRLGEQYVEGAVFAAVASEHAGGAAGRRFETLYESKHGSKPSRQSALGYDAIRLIQNASRGPQTSREALMERLSMVTAYWGASGAISLASGENATGQAKIYTINKGRFKRIK